MHDYEKTFKKGGKNPENVMSPPKQWDIHTAHDYKISQKH